MFKLWSDTRKEAKDILRANFDIRDWNDINENEKRNIWLYLDSYFFNPDIQTEYDMMGRRSRQYYEFYGEPDERELKRNSVLLSIITLNEQYKAKTFANLYLKHCNHNAACSDFYNIFINQDRDVVFELLSIFLKFINDKNLDYFNKFKDRINDIFLQFNIKYYLSSVGFIDRQEHKIIEDIYEPTLTYLNEKKWKEVNDILSDAFIEYRKNTPQGYSNCVTNGVSAIQAFLQILIDNKIGSSEGISSLIKRAQDSNLIPNDKFTKEIFKNIDAILMRERGIAGIAHPKQEYANEKSARLVLNLVMIFIQHCIQR